MAKKTKAAKRRRGRPELTDGSRKSVLVGIRMSEADRELLDEVSEGNISQWARDVLLRAARRQRKT